MTPAPDDPVALRAFLEAQRLTPVPRQDVAGLDAAEQRAQRAGDGEAQALVHLIRSARAHQARQFALSWQLAVRAATCTSDPKLLAHAAQRRGRVLSVTGLRQRAVHCFAEARRYLQKGSPAEQLEAWLDEVAARLEFGEQLDVSDLQQAIDDADDLRLSMRMAFLRMRQAFTAGDLGAARDILASLERKLELPSRRALVHLNQATLALLIDHDPEAADRLAAASQEELPALVETWVLRARSSARLGRIDLAQQQLATFLEGRPAAQTFGPLWAYAQLTVAGIAVAEGRAVDPAGQRALQRIGPALHSTPALEGHEARLWAREARALAIGPTATTSHGDSAVALTALAVRLLGEVSGEPLDEEREGLRALRAQGAAIPLGPWLLEARLARGGQGEVWRARHTLTGETAAVKVSTAKVPEGVDPMAEASAVAALDHPAVVALLDHGKVDLAAHLMTEGGWPVDAPWMAMELVDGGSLRPHCGRMPWSHARQVVLTLLDALAHAHARGVLHLDIKPHNVLLRATAGGFTAALTDFGLARRTDDDHGTRVAGTPAYMSPEQLRGQWRALGPATDLYGLGALVMHLLTGAPPFPHDDREALRAAHFFDAPPPLVSAAGVDAPSGVEAWVHRLLAKEPRQRFASAAHAAAALAAIEQSGPTPAPRPAAPEHPGTATWLRAGTTIQLHDLGDDRPSSPGPSAPTAWLELPPVVHRPKGGAPQRPSGALRIAPHPPMGGRDREQAWLWEQVTGAVSDRRPRGVVLGGASGIGATALATWLGERASEQGLRWVRIAPGVSIRATLAFWLRTRGLSGVMRATQTAAVLGAPTHDPLVTSLCTPAGVVPPQALAEVVARWALERPVVVTIDDADTDPVAAEIAAQLMELSAAVVVVATAREARAIIGDLAAHDLPPLPVSVIADAAGHVAPLTDGLRYELARAARGRIGPALQQLDAWLLDGMLQPGPRGLTLPPGHEVGDLDTPASWQARFSQAVPDAGSAVVVAIAAELGRHLDLAELREVAARLSVAAPGAPVADTLLQRRLWLPEPGAVGRLRFTSETARAAARRDDPAIARACADQTLAGA